MSEEQDLVRLAKKGDVGAFGTLVRANEAKVYNLTLRMTGNPEDARDLAQEAFLLAYRRLPAFRMECSFSTWLYRLTANLCIDFLRRERRRKSMTVSMEDQMGQQEEGANQWQEPQAELERLEMRAVLEQGISRLSEEHRQILLLREMSGLSYEEIGSLLKLEAGTVKSRLARARTQLREILSADGNFSALISSNEAGKEGSV
ncbi:MAG: sigma-70 family RNA polymerase sigma factor [Oscillospiraceae bacterium]|jgi:RNA polymerase sigma factor (sigma-70 family)|nr:sigma-70 family RNA polymerase sigma factor [Oscillospiraceae bacterium]